MAPLQFRYGPQFGKHWFRHYALGELHLAGLSFTSQVNHILYDMFRFLKFFKEVCYAQ